MSRLVDWTRERDSEVRKKARRTKQMSEESVLAAQMNRRMKKEM
jgi:hypothetical protein